MSGRYSGVWAAMKARMEAHCAAGELLEGYRFDEGPFEEARGQMHLPVIRMELPNIAERFVSDQLVTGEFVMVVSVSVHRKLGMVEALEAVELVLDAAETNTAGARDPWLGGLLARPIHALSPTFNATETSITAFVGISTMPKPSVRANRRNEYE